MPKLTEQQYRQVLREVRKLAPGIKIQIDDDVCETDLACYCITDDTIYTRTPTYYRGIIHFRHIMFHELAHWAARRGRGGRIKKLKNKSQNYALEEMVVDAVSFELCKMHGFTNTRCHARYMSGFLVRGQLHDIWTEEISNYFQRKVKSLISFIKKYNKNT